MINNSTRILLIYLALSFNCAYGEITPIESLDFQDANEVEPKDPEKSLKFLSKKKAKIIVLNKITAKSEIVEFKIDETKSLGKISVTVQKCYKNLDPVNSSNLILLNVFENKSDSKTVIFQGWMDSSNLSISTMEHPIYEILPKECVD